MNKKQSQYAKIPLHQRTSIQDDEETLRWIERLKKKVSQKFLYVYVNDGRPRIARTNND